MKKHLQLLLVCCLTGIASGNTYTQIFADITASSGIDHYYAQRLNMGGGVAFFDFNNDGFDDMYLSGGYNQHILYQNNQDGTFSDVTISSGLTNLDDAYTVGAISGDIDNDGDKDLFVYTWASITDESVLKQNLLYINNGDGTFTEEGIARGITDASFSMAATMLDYDLDGFLDIYVGNYVLSGDVANGNLICRPNHFYHNNGDGTFTERAKELGIDNEGCALAVKATDYDLDSDMDIYIANDFGSYGYTPENTLYQNNDASFTDVSQFVGADVAFFAMGIANGDYDLDGDWDMYITNLGKNALIRNDDGVFTRQEDAAGVGNEFTEDPSGDLSTTGWGTIFMDYDNDLWPDLFVANGRVPSGQPNPPTGEMDPCKLYQNNQDGTFSDITNAAGVGDMGRGRGMAASDFDNDGDVDVFVVNQDTGLAGTFSSKFYRNDYLANNNWLEIDLEGVVSNRDAYGALVRLYVNNTVLIRELSSCGSHASQHSSRIHFGLGSNTNVDSLTVVWPNGGVQKLISTTGRVDLSANQIISIVENTTVLPVELTSFSAKEENNEVQLKWTTASEVNNKGFEILRSHEVSRGYEQIGWVNAQGPGEYTFLDTEITEKKTYYYKLRQIDIDGRVNYSSVVPVTIPRGSEIKLIQNPVEDQVSLLFGDAEINAVDIYSVNGKLMKSVELGEDQIDKVDIDVNDLSTGIYFLSIQGKQVSELIKFVKK